MDFKVGDKVSFGGIVGVVESINYLDLNDKYPLKVVYLKDEQPFDLFTVDGRFEASHTTPLLVLIERPISLLKVEESEKVIDKTTTQPFEFKVGDIVEAFGCRGLIVENNPEWSQYAICVEFTSKNNSCLFDIDGRLYKWHETPSLKFIERPKKKVKKTLTKYVLVNADGTCEKIYNIREPAEGEAARSPLGTQVVELTGEYAVEE